jgi:hypothetical protein
MRHEECNCFIREGHWETLIIYHLTYFKYHNLLNSLLYKSNSSAVDYLIVYHAPLADLIFIKLQI